MKRRLLIFVTILLAISTLAHAETFQLHSGVQFGMSMDKVKQLETIAGYTVRESRGSFYGRTDGAVCLSLSAPNLAGVGGAVYYDFDSDNHVLNMCLYSFNDFDDKTIESLVEAYTKKYGNTVAEGDSYIDIPGKAYDAIDAFAEKANDVLYKKVTLKKYYQWIYQLDDGSAVDIMMIEWNQVWNDILGGNPVPDHLVLYVTYSYRSPDEMKLVYNEMQEKEDARNADI